VSAVGRAAVVVKRMGQQSRRLGRRLINLIYVDRA
jgi:hypothetical protein